MKWIIGAGLLWIVVHSIFRARQEGAKAWSHLLEDEND